MIPSHASKTSSLTGGFCFCSASFLEHWNCGFLDLNDLTILKKKQHDNGNKKQPFQDVSFEGIPGPLTVESVKFFFCSGAIHKNEEIIISLASWVGDTLNVSPILKKVIFPCQSCHVRFIHESQGLP